MKNKKFALILAVLLMLCAFSYSAFAAGYPDENEVDLDVENAIDIIGDEVPLAEAAPDTGIDQSGLAMRRAVDVVIFGLGISLASVAAFAAIKKYADKTK